MPVAALRVPFPSKDGVKELCPAALWDESGLVLADCGIVGSSAYIEAALQLHGTALRELRAVILTHHDHDHMDGLVELWNAHPGLIVYCSHEQAPYVLGHKRPLRSKEAEPWNPAPGSHVPEVTIVAPGQTLPFCGGVDILDTKGHMPGHISLYVQRDKTLITGDAIVMRDGALWGPDPVYTYDMDTAWASLKALTHLDIRRVVCYHGGEVTGDVTAMLKELTADK